MKPARLPQASPEAPVRVEFQVQFSGGAKGRRRVEFESNAATPTERPAPATTSKPEPVKGASLDRIPRITRLLVHGHYFEKLVREGVVKDYAEIARLTGLSRARVAQITNLTLLAPDIQELILKICPSQKWHDSNSEHNLRTLVIEMDWREQHRWFTQTIGPGIDF